MGPDTSDILNYIYVAHEGWERIPHSSPLLVLSWFSLCYIMRLSTKNYKKEVLLEVVKKALPCGTYEWEGVCSLYKERYGESNLHDKDDVKRHWVEKMCNKLNKPMGNASPAYDFIQIVRKCKL